MIEIAFGESAAGGLKMAKSMKQGERLNGATAIFGGSIKEQDEIRKPRFWSGLSMEGSSKDVEALTLALDIGDISGMDTNMGMDTGMNARKKQLDALFGDFPGVSDKIWETNQHALTRLQEAKTTLESVRVWVCASNPGEQCGLHFVCHLMADFQTPLSVVRIPDHVEKTDCIVSYRSTGEIGPEEFSTYAKYEEPISGLQRIVYSNLWRNLVRENAPLRAVINGSLFGVPIDFYDFALRANMPDNEFKVALLIGKTLGQIPGIGDRWLFLRVQAMLQSGELVRVSAATEDHPYSEVVKRKSGYVDFPDFMKNGKNRVPGSAQNTEDIEGYYYEGLGGGQMAFWTCYSDRESKKHMHDFDEYTIIVSGQYTACFEDREIVLNPGDELFVPAGTEQWGRCKAGTRSIHAFGGKRIKTE